MKLAYVLTDQTGDLNRALAATAQALIAQGFRVAGTTQTDTPRPKTHHCDMDVQVLPDGPVLRISQDLGEGAKGCRLDADALERAVGLTLPRLDDAELLIINKFGKHEAEGRGFRELIAEALSRDIPVLVGTNALNVEAFQTFCDGMAIRLPADAQALVGWLCPAAKAA
ncbi:DUF2478 domain-containing protein [Shimia sp. W99]